MGGSMGGYRCIIIRSLALTHAQMYIGLHSTLCKETLSACTLLMYELEMLK